MAREVSANPSPLYGLTNGAPTFGARIAQSTVYDIESQLIRGTMSFSKDKLLSQMVVCWMGMIRTL